MNFQRPTETEEALFHNLLDTLHEQRGEIRLSSYDENKARLYYDRKDNLVHSSELQGELQQFVVHPERSRADLLKDLYASAKANFDDGLTLETALLRHIYKLDKTHHRLRGQDPFRMNK
ncbi:MAG: hypothetical protein ACOCZ8_02105 [Bacteroidota bacterium]